MREVYKLNRGAIYFLLGAATLHRCCPDGFRVWKMMACFLRARLDLRGMYYTSGKLLVAASKWR